MEKPYIKRILFGNGVLSFWLVDGGWVRNNLNIDFLFGGHNLAYASIPKDEIWIDDDVPSDEIRFIMLHELVEYKLMTNTGWNIDEAHEKADEVEKLCRKNPNKYNEIWKFYYSPFERDWS